MHLLCAQLTIIFIEHMYEQRGGGDKDDKLNKKKKKLGKTKENIEFSKDLFWLAVVAARLPVVTQLDPKFRLYLPYRRQHAVHAFP